MKSHLLLFIRSIGRHKVFSSINILGLTVSLTCALLLFLYVDHELSFDRFHSHADRIYRVNQTFIWGEGDNRQFASTGPGVATALREELADLDLITSIYTPGNFFLTYTTLTGTILSFEETKVLAADTNFFRMFNFPLLKGTQASLRQANSLVLTQSAARKYFGDEDPVGKLMQVAASGNVATYEVTGVTADAPNNSYIQYDILFSISSFPNVQRLHWSWVWTQLETYIRLKENAQPENTRTALASIPKKYAEETLQRIMNVSYDEYIRSGKKWELFLQPLLEIHLPAEMVYNRIGESGNKKIVYSLAGCGIFILLLACVNFMNLSTAQFSKRIKEVSVRKVLGVERARLRMQYFTEALIFCVLAAIITLALTQLLLPGFNLISGKNIAINFLEDPRIFIGLFGTAVIMAALGSSYPAWFLTQFHPVEGLKGKLKTGQQGKTLRDGLVVLQFSISIILMASTVIVFQQLNFVNEKDLGFDKSNLMVIEHAELLQHPEALAKDALNVAGIVNSSCSTSVPPSVWGGDKFTAEGMNQETFSLNYTSADELFLSTFKIPILFGRNFSKAILVMPSV